MSPSPSRPPDGRARVPQAPQGSALRFRRRVRPLRQQLQRGFQVYKEVCSACHSLKHVAFRDLQQLGYSEAEVKAIAKQWGTKQPTFDPKTGDRGERDNLPADHFPMVYYAGQGSPPDLSLITKARHEGGAYVYSLLTGYQDQPAELLKKFPDARRRKGCTTTRTSPT
jgi:ubiquinol-cytochrome c reductase cytochrome c1 subunit